MLLYCDAKVDQTDHRGNTALLHACANGHLDVVKLLVKHNADVNYTNSRGASPLLCAVGAKRVDLVKWLTSNGADPTGSPYQAVSPLSLAEVINERQMLAHFDSLPVVINHRRELRELEIEARREATAGSYQNRLEMEAISSRFMRASGYSESEIGFFKDVWRKQRESGNRYFPFE